MNPGDRVKILDSCVWPERAGLTATVVAPPANGVYPQPGPGEVIVKIDNDPLEHFTRRHRRWTCVMSTKHLREASQ